MSDTVHSADHSGGHEERDVSIPPIVLTSAILVAVVLLSFVTMWWMLNFLTAREIAQQGPISDLRTAESRREAPPEPRLQTHPIQDLEALHKVEDEQLETYGWVDRDGGVVRIPIERAVELTAQRGLPSQAAK